MCERRLDTGQAVVRYDGLVFVAPLKGDKNPMEYEKVYTDWIRNEVMGNRRFPTTACSCNHPEIVSVERDVEIDGETVRIIADEWC